MPDCFKQTQGFVGKDALGILFRLEQLVVQFFDVIRVLQVVQFRQGNLVAGDVVHRPQMLLAEPGRSFVLLAFGVHNNGRSRPVQQRLGQVQPLPTPGWSRHQDMALALGQVHPHRHRLLFPTRYFHRGQRDAIFNGQLPRDLIVVQLSLRFALKSGLPLLYDFRVRRCIENEANCSPNNQAKGNQVTPGAAGVMAGFLDKTSELQETPPESHRPHQTRVDYPDNRCLHSPDGGHLIVADYRA